MVYFLLLLGFTKGLLPGLVLAFVAGGVTSLLVGFIYFIRESTTVESGDSIKDEKSRVTRRKNLLVIIICYLILLLGAMVTRYSGQIVPLVLSIGISITVFTVYSYHLGRLKRPLQGAVLSTYVVIVITASIQFSVASLIFLLIVYGFDFNRIMSLF